MKATHKKGPLFHALDFERFPPSIDRLDPALTINNITVYPTFRYNLGMACASRLNAWGYGENLIARAGVTASTYNTGSPLLGSLDDSCCFNGTGGAADNVCNFLGTTAVGDIGLNDVVFEIIAKRVTVAIVAGMYYHKTAGGGFGMGWDVRYSGGNTFLFSMANTGTSLAIQSAAAAAGDWVHAVCFIDRSGFGQWYINGVVSGAALDISSYVAANLINTAAVSSVGGVVGGTYSPSQPYAYIAMWQCNAWLDTHLQTTVAANRFAQLTGLYPQKAVGTALPTVSSRASVAYTDKVEKNGSRKLYLASSGFLRAASRVDTRGRSVKGYLSEAAVTNLCPNSEAPGSWTANTNCSIAATSVVAPNGISSATAALHEDGTAGTVHRLQQNIVIVASVKYCFSVFIKKSNRSWVQLMVTSAAYSCYFDVGNGILGTVGASAAGSYIENWGNDWYRCCLVFDSPGAGTSNFFVSIATGDGGTTFNGLNQDSLFVWGAQVELGNLPTSYIPTAAAAVTRNADVLYYKGDDGNLGGVGSNKRNTVKFDCLVPTSTVVAGALLELDDGGSVNDRILYWYYPGESYYIAAAAVNTLNQLAGATIANNTKHSCKFQFQVGSSRSVMDSTVVNGAPADIPDDLDRIVIGTGFSGASQPNGLISNVRIYDGSNKDE